MDLEFQKLVADYLDGSLDEAGRRRLEERASADPAALACLVDHLQLHGRMGVLEGKTGSLVEPVLREVRLLDDAGRFSDRVVKLLKEDGAGPRRRLRLAGGAIAAGIAVFFTVVFLILAGPGEVGGPDADPAEERKPGDVLFISGASPHEEADERVRERLRSRGFTVATEGYWDVTQGDIDGRKLIVFSSTTTVGRKLHSRPDLLAALRRTDVPVLTWEPILYHPLGMIPTDVHQKDWATVKRQTRLKIIEASHPLAAGFSGTVRILQEPLQVSWGRPGADVQTVAADAGDPSKAVIFGYERGAAMPGLRAPARRLGFFFFNETPIHVTDEGWALFDAAVDWCAAGP